MLSHADFEPFVKLLGVPGSEHAGATPRRWPSNGCVAVLV
jgi:hypothetical protein